jgi:hypothetical protein
MRMKKHHTTALLITLFFTGLFVIMWADWADIPTPEEARERSGRVIPELVDIPPIDIQRLEIERQKEKEKGRLVFKRGEAGSWQMIEPIDTAADRSLVETLTMNLKNLRKSLEAGTIEGPDAKYGLAPPTATIRVFARESEAPLATLEVGMVKEGIQYVREVGASGIEVIDARSLNMLDQPAPDWREKVLFTLPSFRVGGLSVNGPGRELNAERLDGKWTLVKPVRALASEDKFEGVIAELANLRVADGVKGFIADNVKDFAPYGLDVPVMTVELRPVTKLETAQTIAIGKAVADKDHPDRFYARRAGQDDVVIVEIKDKDVRDIGINPNALRSQKVTDFQPGLANLIRIADETSKKTIELVKTPAGWELLKPVREKADARAVQSFLTQLATLQTSDFLDPSQVVAAKLDPPNVTIKIWQAEPGDRTMRAPESEPKSEPRVNLLIGAYDTLRKVIFARVAGDPTVLSLPETLLDVLPKNTLAFRDKSMLSLQPGQLQRLVVRRDGTTYELWAPGIGSGSPNQWTMKAPVEARADDEAATKATLALANLRAEEIVTDDRGDGKAFRLDSPALSVSWTTSKGSSQSRSADTSKTSSGTLRISSKGPKPDQFYAEIEGSPMVFTLAAATIEPFQGEFHNRRVLAFPADKAARLVFRWPDRTIPFVRQVRPNGPPIWRPEPGLQVSEFDLNKLPALVGSLANLVTPRFLQYDGPLPPSAGFDRPQLAIEVVLEGELGTRTLRLGRLLTKEEVEATTATGPSGPVFTLRGPAWTELFQSPRPSYELPDDVFAPEL